MRLERFDRVVVTRQFCLCEGCMDFTVADVVQQDCGPAFSAFELGGQMMQTLLDLWRDRTIA